MNDWITAIAQALAKISEMGTQIAENQGDKIPLKEEAIQARAKVSKARSEGTEEKVIQRFLKRKWKNDFEIHREHFTLIQEGNIKNKIESLINSGKIIYRQDLVSTKERYYLYIRYVDDEKCESWIKLEGKKLKL